MHVLISSASMHFPVMIFEPFLLTLFFFSNYIYERRLAAPQLCSTEKPVGKLLRN